MRPTNSILGAINTLIDTKAAREQAAIDAARAQFEQAANAHSPDPDNP